MAKTWKNALLADQSYTVGVACGALITAIWQFGFFEALLLIVGVFILKTLVNKYD